MGLGLLLGGIYATLAHLILGGSLWKLPLFWVFSLVGFAVGQLLGTMSGWDLALVGQTHVLEGTLMSWVFLLFAKRLKV